MAFMLRHEISPLVLYPRKYVYLIVVKSIQSALNNVKHITGYKGRNCRTFQDVLKQLRLDGTRSTYRTAA
jgi:hypothetical protein